MLRTSLVGLLVFAVVCHGAPKTVQWTKLNEAGHEELGDAWKAFKDEHGTYYIYVHKQLSELDSRF